MRSWHAHAGRVVMQEDITRDGDEILLNVDVDAGDFVRRRGCDLSEGQKILSKGERIRAATVALLASQGFSEVTIGGEVDVAIVSTGDELVKPGEKIKQGQIYESNSVLLRSLLQRCNATVRSVENCADDQPSLTEVLKRGIRYHVLIISGGVSVGEHDIVKSTLLSLCAKSNRANHSCSDAWLFLLRPHLNPLPQGEEDAKRQVREAQRVGMIVSSSVYPAIPYRPSLPFCNLCVRRF